MHKRLTLKRETIRQLTAAGLTRAIGGLPTETQTDQCSETCGACNDTGPESVCVCTASGGASHCPRFPS
jgi:hypothetical protein